MLHAYSASIIKYDDKKQVNKDMGVIWILNSLSISTGIKIVWSGSVLAIHVLWDVNGIATSVTLVPPRHEYEISFSTLTGS